MLVVRTYVPDATILASVASLPPACKAVRASVRFVAPVPPCSIGRVPVIPRVPVSVDPSKLKGSVFDKSVFRFVPVSSFLALYTTPDSFNWSSVSLVGTNRFLNRERSYRYAWYNDYEDKKGW